MTADVTARRSGSGSGPGGDVLGSWAEKLNGHATKRSGGCLRFVFYGRVSTEDWQDPVTSRARQLQQAGMPGAGQGTVGAGVFDCGQSPTLAWARGPPAPGPGAAFGGPGPGGGAGRARGG